MSLISIIASRPHDSAAQLGGAAGCIDRPARLEGVSRPRAALPMRLFAPALSHEGRIAQEDKLRRNATYYQWLQGRGVSWPRYISANGRRDPVRKSRRGSPTISTPLGARQR